MKSKTDGDTSLCCFYVSPQRNKYPHFYQGLVADGDILHLQVNCSRRYGNVGKRCTNNSTPSFQRRQHSEIVSQWSAGINNDNVPDQSTVRLDQRVKQTQVQSRIIYLINPSPNLKRSAFTNSYPILRLLDRNDAVPQIP